jgi:EmrB/QacA subfamily drug resistance transporter
MSITKQRPGLIVLAMALGIFMASLDNTIVSACIASVIKDLSGFDKMSWVFTAYALAATSTMLVFGKLSDIYGRKLFFLIGVGLFLAGSALCGQAHNMTELILFRVIQGIGSGALFPISFTIIFTVFGDPKQAAKLSGIFAGIFGISSIAGPQLGTWINDTLSWRWCFYVNVPIGIVSFLALLVSLKETKSQHRPKIDFLGTFLLIVTVVSIMLALSWGGKDYAWSSWQIVGLFATALLGCILFILVEMRAEEPILPLHLFKNRIVTGTSITTFTQGALMFSAITYIPIFSVAVLGQANSNNLLTPLMLSLLAGATISGFIMFKFSYRLLLGGSMLMGIVSSYLLYTVAHDVSKWTMIGIMILLGFFAIGPLMSIAQNAISQNVEMKYIGISSSLIGFWRNIGGVLGASITATIVNNDYKQNLTDGAAAHHIPAKVVDVISNPDVLMHAGDKLQLPPQILGFVRDTLGTAINHGFLLSMIASAIGFVIALTIPGKLERRNPTQAQQTQQTMQPDVTTAG